MHFQIRPLKPGDGAGVNSLRRMPGVFENILGIPSEKVQKGEDFAATTDPNTHAFVAITILDHGEELIIGCASLHVGANPRVRHSGSIGIMVHANYQGKGVGKALMQTLLDIADNWLMLIRVELGVLFDNERALHLYESLGFEIEGTKRNAVIRNGHYVDEIMMSRLKFTQK